MAEAAIASAHALAITDIDTTINGEPRVRDLRLAEALGMADPHSIRRMIVRHRSALESLGVVISHQDAKPAAGVSDHDRKLGRGRPGSSYYLTKKQALYITAKADTPRAAMVTVEMVEIFDAVTSNRLQRATDAAGQVLSLTEQEIMAALAFRRQVQEAVAAQVERALAERRFELGATASIAVSQILAGTLTYDIDTKRFTQRDRALPGGSS